MLATIRHWFVDNFVELGREMRLSYLPPLMVYVAAGVSGLTGIVGTFFVKEYLGLSAAFLAALGFWAVIPWSIKMVIGHLVDLLWRWKSGLIWLGAGLIAASLLIMAGLIGNRAEMAALLRYFEPQLVEEGFARDAAEARAVADDFARLAADPQDGPLRWRLGLDAGVLDPAVRGRELVNWLTHLVKPTRSRRGRA